jgi:hypothetical protein
MVFISDFTPTFSADRQLPAPIVDVKLYVCPLALAVPRILATFN